MCPCATLCGLVRSYHPGPHTPTQGCARTRQAAQGARSPVWPCAGPAQGHSGPNIARTWPRGRPWTAQGHMGAEWDRAGPTLPRIGPPRTAKGPTRVIHDRTWAHRTAHGPRRARAGPPRTTQDRIWPACGPQGRPGPHMAAQARSGPAQGHNGPAKGSTRATHDRAGPCRTARGPHMTQNHCTGPHRTAQA